MSVIVTSDVPFTVPDLPILSMLDKTGLVLGLRPTQTTGIIDISDSHAELTLMGSPAIIEQGMRTVGNNYIQSNVQEPRNLTLIAGLRLISDGTPSSIQQVVGSLQGNSTLSNGSGLYAGLLAGNPNYLGTNYYTSKGPDGIRIVNTFTPGRILQQPVASGAVPTPWFWMAVSVDYDTMTAARYFSIEEGTLISDGPFNLDPDGAGRTRTNITIGKFSDGSGDLGWTFEFAEVLVYDRFKDEMEMGRQYQDSLGYMQAVNARIGT